MIGVYNRNQFYDHNVCLYGNRVDREYGGGACGQSPFICKLMLAMLANIIFGLPNVPWLNFQSRRLRKVVGMFPGWVFIFRKTVWLFSTTFSVLFNANTVFTVFFLFFLFASRFCATPSWQGLVHKCPCCGSNFLSPWNCWENHKKPHTTTKSQLDRPS